MAKAHLKNSSQPIPGQLFEYVHKRGGIKSIFKDHTLRAVYRFYWPEISNYQ